MHSLGICLGQFQDNLTLMIFVMILHTLIMLTKHVLCLSNSEDNQPCEPLHFYVYSPVGKEGKLHGIWHKFISNRTKKGQQKWQKSKLRTRSIDVCWSILSKIQALILNSSHMPIGRNWLALIRTDNIQHSFDRYLSALIGIKHWSKESWILHLMRNKPFIVYIKLESKAFAFGLETEWWDWLFYINCWHGSWNITRCRKISLYAIMYKMTNSQLNGTKNYFLISDIITISNI